MARGINKVILVGNLGQDPEVKYTASGAAVATLNIATSEQWTDKRSGQKQEKTEWHRVVMFSRLGEIAGEYLKKGAQVYIEGKLQTRKWQDQTGQDRYTTEIVASEMQMLGGNAGSGGNGQADYRGHSGSNHVNPSSAPAQQPRSQVPQQAPAQQGGGFDDYIPFTYKHSMEGG